MIDRLLAAFAEGAEDGIAPRTAVGAEEIADILWLAARVDPAAAQAPAPAPAAGDTAAQPPSPPPAPPGPAPASAPGAAQLFPAGTRPGTSAGHADGEGGRRGVPLRLPRTASLDDPLGLMRSLRPVGRRSIGGPGEELDEQLTVERSIEAMVPTPVLRPAESRWLDLALVVDTHHSMLLWADLVAELSGVFTRSGVFRDVRTWQLGGTGRGATPQLARGPGGAPRNPLELADPAGRRLILVVSDTVAGGWQEGPLRAVLRHWSSHNAVAVLNVLPERLWSRGAVRPVPFAVRSDRPAAATRSWQRVPAARRARGGGPAVPVVGLASGSLGRLVRVVSGDGRWRRLACLRLDAAPDRPPAPPRRAADPLELVERFRAGASPTAQQLAAHLAAVPLTLPVMTLVRRSLLRGSEHGHLAEVALGGLFAPWDGQQRSEETEFEFLPGVREALLGSQLRGDVAAVRELVRRRVWEFMSRNRGTGPDFSATRVTTGEEGRRLVPEGALPFAERGPADPAEAPDSAPAADGGLGDRVVRVGFESLREPTDVGTLLAPRLVLTVGQVLPRPGETAAWVRAGGREFACRAVWWDDASPPVLLLESERDLADPARFVPQLWGTPPPGAEARLRVDGATEAGQPAALTGALVGDGGAANGELVRLSPEPETWTHFVGGPVSHEGRLLGVVHTLHPDRLVFLSGTALLDQASFRSVLDAHPPARSYRTQAHDGPQVTVDVRVGQGAMPRGSSAVEELRDLMARLMTGSQVGGSLLGGAGSRTLHLLIDAPDALSRAGRLLVALPATLSGHRGALGEGVPPLALVLGTSEREGEPEEAERLIDHGLVAERLRGARRGRGGRLLLALSQRLYEELGERVGPAALSAFTPLGDGAGAWVYGGDPRQLGELLERAGESVRDTAAAWPPCRAGITDAEPLGCPGIRLPGRRACLTHLTEAEQDAFLRTLGPDTELDLRGTTFADGLLGRVLDAVREPETGVIRLGRVDFTAARFEGGWAEEDVLFTGDAGFAGAEFAGPVRFRRAFFHGRALFEHAVFHGEADFTGSDFSAPASFDRADFTRDARFLRAVWSAGMSFRSARLREGADMGGMTVSGPADLTGTACGRGLTLDGAVFADGASFAGSVCEGRFSAKGTRFDAEAVFDHLDVKGEAVFDRVHCAGPATFAHAAFEGAASFEAARFEGFVDFNDARFAGTGLFRATTCRGGASFDRAVFEGLFQSDALRVGHPGAGFRETRFKGSVLFLDAEFTGGAVFDETVFDGLFCIERSEFRAGLSFEGAVFHGRVEFTDVQLGRSLSLPGDWTVTQADGGLWDIVSPHPPDPPGEG
ncbi:pentapeptide repeat-containing protein [Streptomyces sp. NPDC006662]|uniref:pentapeptide repeat-containing protein n=1 Tax=Streptomyces sp. NPDC006662 TaxID=3156902 RepID=UPI0033E6A7BD